jgi:hypothetical protein
MRQDPPKNKKLIIHTCCAICGSEIADALKKGYEPEIFFYNPNIYDPEEYERRRDSAEKLAEDIGIPFSEGPYDRSGWSASCGTMPDDPEGGKRCEECFKLRLRRTAEEARKRGFEMFTTTLAASPYKNEEFVGNVGQEEAEREKLTFIDPLSGREKKEAWKKAVETAKRSGYYRQKYCGCEFSDYRKKGAE